MLNLDLKYSSEIPPIMPVEMFEKFDICIDWKVILAATSGILLSLGLPTSFSLTHSVNAEAQAQAAWRRGKGRSRAATRRRNKRKSRSYFSLYK